MPKRKWKRVHQSSQDGIRWVAQPATSICGSSFASCSTTLPNSVPAFAGSTAKKVSKETVLLQQKCQSCLFSCKALLGTSRMHVAHFHSFSHVFRGVDWNLYETCSASLCKLSVDLGDCSLSQGDLEVSKYYVTRTFRYVIVRGNAVNVGWTLFAHCTARISPLSSPDCLCLL
jgi:hypothetical protein